MTPRGAGRLVGPFVQMHQTRRLPRTQCPLSILSTLRNLPGAPSSPQQPQTIRARRTMPYPKAHVYALIADVGAYKDFLPHCTESRVTAWAPGPGSDHGESRWPARAHLTVGWGPFVESYTSRVYCVPGEVVEAVAGSARPTIPAETLARLGFKADEEPRAGASASSLFESLVTRWEVRSVPTHERPTARISHDAAAPKDWTDVILTVQFLFANPALGFAVGQVADQKVDEMIQAFEDRAKRLYA